MIFKSWYEKKLCSDDRVDRFYTYTYCVIILLALVFVFLNPPSPENVGGAPLCDFWAAAIAILVIASVYFEQKQSGLMLHFVRLALFLMVGFSVLIFFDGSNVINRVRYNVWGSAMLWDEALLKGDNMLLGFFFPQGQLSLWLDTNPFVGVTSPIAPIYTEVLQIMYGTYYIWGNALQLWLGLLHFYPLIFRKDVPLPIARTKVSWRQLQLFQTAWVGTYLLNFILNMIVPAVSPRIYIASQFKNEIRGLFFANVLRKALTTAASNTFSAFPSGHCALSWLTAYLAYVFGYMGYAKANVVIASLITTATLVLRYHYFVDFLFAIPMLFCGLLWSGLLPHHKFAQILAIAVGSGGGTEKGDQTDEDEEFGLVTIVTSSTKDGKPEIEVEAVRGDTRDPIPSHPSSPTADAVRVRRN